MQSHTLPYWREVTNKGSEMLLYSDTTKKCQIYLLQGESCFLTHFLSRRTHNIHHIRENTNHNWSKPKSL